jgi:3-oxoacyl-[acyl-carrier protein] reductase
MGRLDGKVAIVTGAGRGLGRSFAKAFAAEGAKVAVVSLSEGNLMRTVKEITDAGGAAIGVQCDVTDRDQIKRAVAETIGAWGTVDILVNNAMEFSSVMGQVTDLTFEQVERQFLGGPVAALMFMQACYPYLERKGGRVINMGSSAGVMGAHGLAAYGMAKEAIRALTRSAAREWGAKGITVNCICPIAHTDSYDQSTATGELLEMPVLPISRLGDPDKDVAPVALFLASDDSAYMTGYTLMADGGFMIDASR